MGYKLLLEACIISGRWIGEVWARSFGSIVHRPTALIAVIITQHEMSQDSARTQLSHLILAYSFEILVAVDSSLLSAVTWIRITMN